ncbi:MAG: CoA transferase [Rhodobiaceae bacterium]|nr:CoA transferase [Rhodobiaceae bacterium]
MLEGIRVIEMATYIAAPGAGGIMADWGADVVKVEPLSGCPMRHFLSNIAADGLQGNPVFTIDNRGKKGVALDTSKPEGVAALKKLIRDADVFLTNVRPGGLERAGLDYESLKAINPKLIYASVTGYGLTGPDRDKPGFDVAAFYARSGIGRMATPKGQEPAPLRMANGDHTTAMATVAGILAALLERGKTGKGKLVEASLLRAGIYTGGSDMSIQLMFGKLATSKSRHEAIAPISNFFLTQDEHWIALVPRQGQPDWAGICRALDRPDLTDNPLFANPRARRENAAALVDIMDEIFASKPLAHWRERLDAEDQIWSPMQHPSEVVKDPQAIAAGAFVDIAGPDGTTAFKSPAGPIRFSDEDAGLVAPAPELGQHTEEVLRAAGLTDEEWQELKSIGAVA